MIYQYKDTLIFHYLSITWKMVLLIIFCFFDINGLSYSYKLKRRREIREGFSHFNNLKTN